MQTNEQKVLDDALKLPLQARAALVGSLIDSLDEEVDEDSEAAWGEEIARRIKEIDSGKVKMVPWAEARRQILNGGEKS